MSNRRSLILLLLALVVTIAAHLLLNYQSGVASALVPRTTLLNGTSAKVERIRIVRCGDPGAEVALNGRWRLVKPYAASVDEMTVVKLLDALETTEVEDSYSDQELLRLDRRRSDFALAPPRVRIILSAAGSDCEVGFGLLTPSRDGVYATVNGDNAVYVVASNLLAAVDLPPEGFRLKSLFQSEPDSVNALDLKRGAGSFMRFQRDGETWSMVHPCTVNASAVKIRKLLSAITQASAVDFVWPTGAEGEPTVATSALLAGYGLDSESAVTMTVKSSDGIDRQIVFGKEAREGLVYALVQNGDAVVTVDAKLKDAASADAVAFTDTRLFPGETDSLTRLSVVDGGTVYLLAKGENGEWRLDAPVAASTDEAGIATLIGRIRLLRTADLRDDGVTVSLGTNAVSATVSRSALLNGFRLENLRDREILRVNPAQLKRIVTVRGGDTASATAVVFDRDRRVWNVESSARPGTVDVATVTALASALDPLRAEWIVKLKVSAADLRAYGLESPRWAIAVDQEKNGAVRRNILIGDDVQGGSYATLGATDAVFVLPSETVDRLTAPLVTEKNLNER